jgi:hypothetical protein
VLVVSVQPVVVMMKLELAVVLAHAAMAKLLGVARGLVAEGLVAEEQKIGVDYNSKDCQKWHNTSKTLFADMI